MTLEQEMLFSIAHNFRHSTLPPPRSCSMMVKLLLVISGGIEINPGPRTTKFPCGECGKSVRFGNAIACDTCDKWYHKDCTGMRTVIFNAYVQDGSSLECDCGMPNISPAVFKTLDKTTSSASESFGEPQAYSSPKRKKKSKQLRNAHSKLSKYLG